ncbi:MAG: ribonuclease J [Oscillospiraceae bacterium]|nr:ribonuclease J [Oscillospiraceae bacterium]
MLPPRGVSPESFDRQLSPAPQSETRSDSRPYEQRRPYKPYNSSKPYYNRSANNNRSYDGRQQYVRSYDKPYERNYDRSYDKPASDTSVFEKTSFERSYEKNLPRASYVQDGRGGYQGSRYRNSGYESQYQRNSNIPESGENDIARSSDHSNHRAIKRTPLKIIPLGGLNEIGKNMTVFECGNDMFIVDCGLAFPDSDMPGVDLVIPDFTYVEQNISKVRGIVITHGHEDHIGSLAYLLKKCNIPVYATRLTIGLIEGKLKEHNLTSQAKLNVISPRQTVKMGCMAVEFIRVNHSIPDAVGLAIHTPAGIVIHTGDFKVDFTPIEGGIIDLARFGELGNRGVLALMSDSTNAERPGHTASERTVGESFEKLFAKAEGKRIIIATFASNIHRIQQIINKAVSSDRKVAVFGRSMLNVISTAMELGYLSVPDGVIIDLETMNKYPPEKIVLITTGSQGEPMSALTRMAMNEHRSVTITPMDYIIISANPIPGNEKYVTKVVNELLKAGAEVIYESMYDVHVSGHACQEELKLIMALTRPRFFIPVHGEYKHLKKSAALAYSLGIPESNVIIGSIGDVIETDGVNIGVTGKVQAGRVLVDGLGVGDVGSIVLRDRKHLAEDGLIVVVATIESESGTILAGPDILSRGFVYVRENEEMMEAARDILRKTLEACLSGGVRDWNSIKSGLRDSLSDYIYMKTKRNPMILPIIEEI